VVCAVLSACSGEPITQTAFVRSASDAASLLAASSETIRSVHEEPARLTIEYAKASIFNYNELLAPVPQDLPTLDGAPAPPVIDELVAMLNTSLADLASPCLVGDCDWESQVADMDAAKDALLQATQ
jgi:hypothetical protein